MDYPDWDPYGRERETAEHIVCECRTLKRFRASVKCHGPNQHASTNRVDRKTIIIVRDELWLPG